MEKNVKTKLFAFLELTKFCLALLLYELLKI